MQQAPRTLRLNVYSYLNNEISFSSSKDHQTWIVSMKTYTNYVRLLGGEMNAL